MIIDCVSDIAQTEGERSLWKNFISNFFSLSKNGIGNVDLLFVESSIRMISFSTPLPLMIPARNPSSSRMTSSKGSLKVNDSL